MDPATLRSLYVERRLSTRKVAAVLGVSSFTVRTMLRRAGIEVRSVSDAKTGQKPAPQTILASVRARRRHRLPGRPEVGYKLNSEGYVLLLMPKHPMSDGQGYVKEHRLILANRVGRTLRPEEDGHHANHLRADNAADNLELMANRADHQREHARTRRRVQGRFA